MFYYRKGNKQFVSGNFVIRFLFETAFPLLFILYGLLLDIMINDYFKTIT